MSKQRLLPGCKVCDDIRETMTALWRGTLPERDGTQATELERVRHHYEVVRGEEYCALVRELADHYKEHA